MKRIFTALTSSLLILMFSEAALAETGISIRHNSLPDDFIQTGYAEAVLTARFVIDGKPVPGVAVHWEIMGAEN